MLVGVAQATIIRESYRLYAARPRAIVLDDQPVHTDLSRLVWFADTLRTIARDAQVLTYRPNDYTSKEALASGPG